MEAGVKRYIRSESASCAHMVEESAANNRKNADPHEKLKALLNAPDDDTDDTLPPSDAPKFGTVIHNRIFVGGFSLTTTDEDLWKFFSGFATVTAARVIYDRAGVSKCYGFVTFASPRVARLIVKQVWTDKKHTTKKIAASVRRDATGTGGGPPNTNNLSNIELRVLEIMGDGFGTPQTSARVPAFPNLSGGVMFSPLGRLRVAQAVRKQTSQLPAEAAPLPAPLCYQLLCPPLAPLPPCAPCDLPPPYALYQLPYDTTPAMYAPPTQYALLPAAYGAPCCEPACCTPLDKTPRAPPPPLHPAFIY